MAKNVSLYPWFKFCQNLVFWQAVWFLYFQNELSAAEAILLYAVYDVATTLLEVPSGYMSDRLGRRLTLIASAAAGLAGAALLALGESFLIFALAQVLIGTGTAFASGTDNALLYESLAATGRKGEIERQELRAWRFSFSSLALSAVLGGIMALYGAALPFFATAAACAVLLVISLRFQEPGKTTERRQKDPGRPWFSAMKTALSEPVLIWFFWLSIALYIFSHVPFVFGQPFILDALKGTGFEAGTPIVSGLVSAAMMILSVITSLFALRLRNRLGLPAILLLAFAMQIGLCGLLALTNEAIAIVLLFLRMVPDSLSRPFILARIQPLLGNQNRATYMSLQSFCGRLIFAGTLILASGSAREAAPMPYHEIQDILIWYLLGGVLCITLLTGTAIGRKIDHGARR